MKCIVIYKSKYGSSKQYALWIAEALYCKAESVDAVRSDTLTSYDVIIYVGGLYAGGVNGFKKIKKHLNVLKDKKLILCMVGMTNPADHDKYQQVFTNNVPEQYRGQIKPFALRGNQFFSKMSFLHRLMMKVPKSIAEKTSVEKRTADDILFLESFGKDVRYAKQENIRELVEYVQGYDVSPIHEDAASLLAGD